MGAGVALLLLANSIRDYRFVSRFIAIEQVRHQMSQRATTLERQLRQDPLTRGSAVKALMEAGATRCGSNCAAADGKVLEHLGAAAQRLFSQDEERSHARNHEPLFTVVDTSVGDVGGRSLCDSRAQCAGPSKSSGSIRSTHTMMLDIACRRALPIISFGRSSETF